METIPAPIFIAAGAVTAAVITGLFSYFNLVISKEQKISEFRQAWIDGLREDLAKHHSALGSIKYIYAVYQLQHKGNVNFVDQAKDLRESHMMLSAAFSRIMLRLNPNDESVAHQGLIKALIEAQVAFNDTDYEKAFNKLNTIRDEARLVLKEEWEIVKAGERVYRLSKAAAIIVLILGLVFGGIFLLKT